MKNKSFNSGLLTCQQPLLEGCPALGGFVQDKGIHLPQFCFGGDKIKREKANVLVIYCCITNHPRLNGVT